MITAETATRVRGKKEAGSSELLYKRDGRRYFFKQAAHIHTVRQGRTEGGRGAAGDDTKRITSSAGVCVCAIHSCVNAQNMTETWTIGFVPKHSGKFSRLEV